MSSLRKEFTNTAIKAALEAGKAILEVYNSTDLEIEFKSDNSPVTRADMIAHNIILEHLLPLNIPVLSEESDNIPFAERKMWKKFWLVDPLDGTKEFIKRNHEFTVNIALIENNLPVLGIVYTPVKDILYIGELNMGAFRLEQATQINDINTALLISRAIKLPDKQHDTIGVVASRSHLNNETSAFIEGLKRKYPDARIVTKGSSLKLCMIAEGEADYYPRFAPTYEWDIAAGHALLLSSGAYLQLAGNDKEPFVYNKENLLNPWFIAGRNKLKPNNLNPNVE